MFRHFGGHIARVLQIFALIAASATYLFVIGPTVSAADDCQVYDRFGHPLYVLPGCKSAPPPATPAAGSPAPDTTPPSPTASVPQPPTPTPAGPCKIEGSMALIALARPDIVGRCVESAHPDANSPQNTIQATTKGMLAIVRGQTYFTNSIRTWWLGNRAIYERAPGDTCPGEPGPATVAYCRETPLVVSHIDTQTNSVALTIDDGWDEESIRVMANAIISTGNRATFFINGRYYRQYRQLILDLDKTGQIYFANHTDDHADLAALARNGDWAQVDHEILYGDPLVNIPELKHATRYFRFPYLSDGSSGPSDNSELKRLLVFRYGYTIVSGDDISQDATNSPQSLVDRNVFFANPGQVILSHLIPRNEPTFKMVLRQLNARGVRADDLDDVIDQSLSRPSHG